MFIVEHINNPALEMIEDDTLMFLLCVYVSAKRYFLFLFIM